MTFFFSPRITRTACNNTHRHFIHLTVQLIQQKFHRHRRFRRQTLTWHQAMPPTTIQHKSTPHMETIILDNSERRNKIIRDTTTISTTVTITQIIHLMSARRARAVVRIFISQHCPKVRLKRSQAHRPASVTHHNRHYQSHQILATIRSRMWKQRRQPKEKHVDEDNRTQVPRDQHWTIHPRLRAWNHRRESSFGISMRQSSSSTRCWRGTLPIAIIRFDQLVFAVNLCLTDNSTPFRTLMVALH